MNTSATLDEVEKVWDHPWTTEEMRENRNEWSLAGDVGLLKHLEQFSKTLTAKANETQNTLDSLSSQLNETTVLIDNVTNASLALANTQFIESRVHEDEDDQEHEQQKKTDTGDKSKALSDAEMIALVSKNIQQGLQIMDEKYERVEVIASDSEDETEMSVPSFILRPKDPYKDRPLPYVIGSDKWKSSSKIGIESSSSSESEGKNENDSESSEDDNVVDDIFNSTIRNPSVRPRSLSPSSSSASSDFIQKSNTTKQFSGPSSNADRLYTRSQDTLNSTSEITTPINEIPKLGQTDKVTPNFAKELTKKLGNIAPSSRSATNTPRESHSPSINRSEDDLFNAEDNDDDILSVKSDSLFNRNLFNEEVSNSLWDNKIFKRPQSNIIPASMDIPPPIHSVETKQKSAMDDLFGDIDSEDSDDIFSSKTSTKITVVKTNDMDTDLPKNKLGHKINIGEISTSTPETNTTNIPNLFSDEEDDNLFSPVKQSNSNKSLEKSKVLKKEKTHGLPVSQNDLLSSSLGSKLFQRTNQESSESSETEDSAEIYENKTRSNTTHDNVESYNNGSNITSNASAMIAGNGAYGESGNSSGVFVQPQSISSILSSGLGFETPQMESTRLMSEEFSRGRIISDSLLNVRSCQEAANSGSDVSNPTSESHLQEASNNYEDNLFNDDVFSPPPLPRGNSKSKSKVNSLFDDSDSGDDLFSNTSSGSRSQKSTDLLANSSQSVDKLKTNQKGGLFDEDIDIFANRSIPDIDIFNSDLSEPRILQPPSNILSNKISNNSVIDEIESKKSLTSVTKTTHKIPNIFEDSEDEDDLFGPKITKPSNMLSEDDSLFTNYSNSTHKDLLVEPKKDSITEKEMEKGEKISQVKLEEKRDSEQVLALAKESSNVNFESKLFHDSESDDDSLFNEKKSLPEKNTLQSIVQEILVEKDTKTSSVHTQEQIIEDKDMSTVDGGKISKMENPKQDTLFQDNSIKKPPTSLKIRLPTAISDDDLNSVPRRVVSGKIKDLMGKMGDLKILSPTDTPLTFRKIGEKQSDSDITPDHDSEDGSSISIPSAKSPPLTPSDSISKRETLLSPSIETESAVSFDIPAQAESQTIKGSKILQNRARIPVKRRPQSRHARQSALRTSGIDFDDVDKSESTLDSTDSSILDLKNERLTAHTVDNQDELGIKRKSGLNITLDDKSEISVGKEGSINTTKNTLLSPSTDEEDLFDVPPDLPEDPPKEDGLFGRAPLLSPIRRRQSPERINDYRKKENSDINREIGDKLLKEKKLVEDDKNAEEPIDPLRDGNHDPLKDPSQLFAFVTKTPSPEKGQNLLFDEDDSLFSKSMKKTSITSESLKKKLDLFDDDSSNDLFAGPFTKPVKKSIKDVKNSLFDLSSDNEESDDLFGSVSIKKNNQNKPEQSDIDVNKMNASSTSLKITDDLNNDDDDEELFFDASEKLSSESGKDDQLLFSSSTKIPKTKLKDIFGDHSSSEDDIFTTNKTLSKTTPSRSFFSTDAKDKDRNGLFATKKPSTSMLSEIENRMSVKKSVTKDLKKTAEKIVEDPLSMLDDD